MFSAAPVCSESFVIYLIIFGFIDMLTDILNVDHVVNINRNAFDLGVLLYSYQVYVCKTDCEAQYYS